MSIRLTETAVPPLASERPESLPQDENRRPAGDPAGRIELIGGPFDGRTLPAPPNGFGSQLPLPAADGPSPLYRRVGRRIAEGAVIVWRYQHVPRRGEAS